MVQRYQAPIKVYKYPFELVMMAYERRFPSCPQIPVVLNCKITSDIESADGSIRKTERRCEINVEAPYLLKKIIGVEVIYFIQRNSLNRQRRVLDIEVHNESFTSRVSVKENCRYYVHPQNSNWTCFEQYATLDVKSFLGFENAIEKLAMKQYCANIDKGMEVVEYFVNQLKREGITQVPVWTPPNAVQEAKEVSPGISSKDEKGKSVKEESNKDQFQLETDYIKRYLGELSQTQESSLVQLKKSVADMQKGKLPSDATLLRFLRAKDFNVEKAREMLSRSLAWRKNHAVDTIPPKSVAHQVFKDYFPGGWHHHDKDGRPLFLLRLGVMDVRGLIKSIGANSLLKLILAVCEEGLKLMEEATRTTGKPISTWTLLVDLEDLGSRHLWRPWVKTLMRIIEIVKFNYPETMGRVFVVRPPKVFPMLWNFVKTYIDVNTGTKSLFYKENDHLSPGGLDNYISKDFLPDFLGGPCQVKFSSGGVVPKALYMTNEELEREGCAQPENDVYSSVVLGPGKVYEVTIRIDEPQTLIFWDFIVMDGDITFSIFYTNCPSVIPENKKNSYTISDSDIKEKTGITYTDVELPAFCSAEKTVKDYQDYHRTDRAGYYILQWKSPSGRQSDSLDQRDAQMLLFYETVNPSDSRDSMSSLQSGDSAFSSLSNSS